MAWWNNLFGKKKKEWRPPVVNNEPEINIISSGIEKDGRVRIGLDYNDEFVQHLRKAGVRGLTDDDVVENWLAMLSGQIMNAHQLKLSQQVKDGNSEFT